MKFLALLALTPLAMAFVAKRQEGIPGCVSACFTAAGEGPCKSTDVACQCTNQEAQRLSTQCLIAGCSPEEFKLAIGFAAQLCSAQGVEINTALPEGVTAPAGYLESAGFAGPAETGAESSAAAPSVSAAASSATSAAGVSVTPAPSATGTTGTITGTSANPSLSASSSTAAAQPSTTNGAMPTGVVHGFVAAGVGAVLLGVL